MMSAILDRAQIITDLRAELVGPRAAFEGVEAREVNDEVGGTMPDHLARGLLVDASGQEVRRTIPLVEFGMGVLHPPGTPADEPESEDNAEPESDSGKEESLDLSGDRDAAQDRSGEGELRAESSDCDLDIAGCNRLHQSSIGITFAAKLPPGSAVTLVLPPSFRFPWQQAAWGEDCMPAEVNGMYKSLRKTFENGREITLYRRTPICRAPDGSMNLIEHQIEAAHLLEGAGVPQRYEIKLPDPDLRLDLEFQVLARPVPGFAADERLLTVTLVNRSRQGASQLDGTLFQSLFYVEPRDGASIIAYPEAKHPDSAGRDDAFAEEEARLDLLYRDVPAWAIGHGCSATWDWRREGEAPERLVADVFPVTELPSMNPDALDANGDPISIEIGTLAAAEHDSNWWQPLQRLLEAYEAWLTDLEDLVATHSGRVHDAARKNLANCRLALERMKSGLRSLRTDPVAFEAFRLANLAMLLQQRAQKDLDRRELTFSKSYGATPSGSFRAPTEVEEATPKAWRAFQIAFILMAIDDLRATASSHRPSVDLIWFPTGGGKTEAYLGVAAFTLFLERLRDGRGDPALPGDGVNVLMRYTLRMLTTQQFQRAAALICAMEYIRCQEQGAPHGPRLPLGGGRFSLGLWIGSQSSPNKREAAYQRLKRYRKASPGSHDDRHPMVVRECPWCRAEIGKAKRPKGVRQRDYETLCIAGIEENSVDKSVVIKCSDPSCPFGTLEASLPIYIVDEDIYEHRPSFLIGTVDKFAMLPFLEQTRSIFGFDVDGTQKRVKRPPCLIIQDELHLISGPLGSLYGLYEALIEQLCTEDAPSSNSCPKIICSTATIRGADEQVRALFGRTDCRLFPPPALTIGDSFFGRWAREDDGQLKPGRMHVGINAPNYTSALTAQVRTFAACLQAAQSRVPAERRDPWWTLLAFYNAFRDLGGGRTLLQSDIPSRLTAIAKELDFRPEQRRWTPSPLELSGRLSQEEVIDALDDLAVNYDQTTADGYTRARGACLSSSIIEVGVDVDRLSLLAVIGQPASTSRYIQVAGRVGRRWWERPGLVLTIYNATRPRDRSHLEQFQGYHQRLYAQVEPTSATPFSDAALYRALHAVIVAYLRCEKGWQDYRCPSGPAPWPLWKEAVELLRKRISSAVATEPEHAESVLSRVADTRLREWRRWMPTTWVAWMPSEGDMPLLRQPGAYFSRVQRYASWLTPTSMRNVDAQGELAITSKYLEDESNDGDGA